MLNDLLVINDWLVYVAQYNLQASQSPKIMSPEVLPGLAM